MLVYNHVCHISRPLASLCTLFTFALQRYPLFPRPSPSTLTRKLTRAADAMVASKYLKAGKAASSTPLLLLFHFLLLFSVQQFAHAEALDLVARDPHFDFARRQQQPEGSPLYLNSPACDYFQCAVIWHAGEVAAANWLDAPEGDVKLQLLTNASTIVAYDIATVPSISQAGYCDAGYGVGTVVTGTTCGRLEFVIPSSWSNGNYTMRATSVQQPSLESYTDVILIQNNASTPQNVAFSTLVINGAPTATIQGGGINTQPANLSPTAGNQATSSTASATAPTSAVSSASSSPSSTTTTARPSTASSAPPTSSSSSTASGGNQNGSSPLSSQWTILLSLIVMALATAALVI